jgi:alpha-glucosidase (family GH31 glycosyl hydrolase)
VDFFTNERYTGPATLTYSPLAGLGGPVMVPVGAIIPMSPFVPAYWGERPLNALDLHIYPGESGRFTLIEDDGVTLEYRDGAIAKTEISFTANSGMIAVTVGERVGQYKGMPPQRAYRVMVHSLEAPMAVTLNGESATDWHWIKPSVGFG